MKENDRLPMYLLITMVVFVAILWKFDLGDQQKVWTWGKKPRQKVVDEHIKDTTQLESPIEDFPMRLAEDTEIVILTRRGVGSPMDDQCFEMPIFEIYKEKRVPSQIIPIIKKLEKTIQNGISTKDFEDLQNKLLDDVVKDYERRKKITWRRMFYFDVINFFKPKK